MAASQLSFANLLPSENFSGAKKVSLSTNGQKIYNGVWPGHSMPMQSTGMSMEVAQKARSQPPISLQEFKVAMELNPQQLGKIGPCSWRKFLCV